MQHTNPRKRSSSQLREDSPFQLQKTEGQNSQSHILKPGIICGTEKRGHPTPRGRSRAEIVVDASEGFIPLWAKETTLRWRFQESSMTVFKKPAAAKGAIRKLLGDALLAWDDALPVKFAERNDAWDFEVVMKKTEECDNNGCVLASAFFPDGGRHKLFLYPTMFQMNETEQVETLTHEIGHVFGLRHFFALIKETAWPAQVFGKHKPFSIMNYGEQSKLTKDDKADLKRLYQTAWSGELKVINGTPIKLVKSFHTTGHPQENVVAIAPLSHPNEIVTYVG